VVDAPAAVTWLDDAPKMGVERDDLEDEIEDRETLASGVSFEYAIDNVLFARSTKDGSRCRTLPNRKNFQTYSGNGVAGRGGSDLIACR
jgi:hypothetical protein